MVDQLQLLIPICKDILCQYLKLVNLILQAGSLGLGGEIFILDMGSPVKIIDIAKDLIRLSGLEPDIDIAIKYTGSRPGKKQLKNYHYPMKI